MNQLHEIELQELEAVPAEEKQQFVITDMNGLNWAFRKMNAIKAKANDVKALADAERERIAKWEKAELSKYESDLAYFEQKISEYHAAMLEQDPKAKTIKTPYGIAKSTTSKAQPEKVDEATLIDYAKQNELPVVDVVTTEKLKWAELKKSLKVVERGEELVVVDENGEIVPGVAVKPQTVTFKVEVID